MIKRIQHLLFAWKYKKAVRQANELSRLLGMKYYVLVLDKRLKVVPKQTVKELVKMHRFRKGVTVEDIEKRALYIADGHKA